MKRPNFESASGLRPASAYLMIGLALVVVCGRSWVLACEEEHHQPRGSERVDVLPAPDFDLVDRERRVLAQSVQRMDLRLSPRSMWQAHTPDAMAEKVADLLGEEFTREELLAAFLPSAQGGVIRVADEAWRLDFASARRLEAWAHELGIDRELSLVRQGERPLWEVHWRPAELLSRETRARVARGEEAPSPIEWTRRLADGLLAARDPQLADAERPPTFRERERRRSRVWRAFLPCAHTVALRGLPPGSVLGLLELLDAESVQAHQMSIEFEHERVYPARAGSELGAAWQVLGRWSYLSEDAARRAARELEDDPEGRGRLARELLDVKHPRNGLEGVAADLLAAEAFRFIDPTPASYRYRRCVPVLEEARRYFYGDECESSTPQILTTLDGELQEFLQAVLEETVAEHDAAASLGIVVEVETGDVLAVGGASAYEVAEFLPTWHLFSPGSTFKVVAMTTALEAGVVHKDEVFDTFDGHYNVPSSRRVIREARGAPRGRIPAWEAISRSVNAVLVQIGMRVPAPFFREKLLALGYAEPPGVGVGVERAGYLPELPWSPAYTHASVSFGHELSVTLWQHAAALATILRGGVPRPLRVVTAVEWEDEHHRLRLEEGPRVYSRASCRTVRSMMAEGARTGTGRHLAKRERESGTPIELLSKTGTTEKEPGAPCLHLELERNQHNASLPGGRQDPGFVTFTEMKARPRPHRRSCYTSSICLVGRVAGEERELMVLFVVDEPRSKLKFGSDVAGPAAMKALKEALGLTRGGEPVAERAAVRVDYGYAEEPPGEDLPWRMAHEVYLAGGEGSW